MGLGEIFLLLAAGLAAGTINAVAGGGSLVTYPTLLAVGLSPISANVTNSIAVSPGYLGAVAGSRQDLVGQGRRVRHLIVTAAVGSAIGCALLLLTPEETFRMVVPFLVLAATAALAFQDRLRRLVNGHGRPRGDAPPGPPPTISPRRSLVSLHLMVGLAAIYGGYFGAALGVALVALLALVVNETLARVSALKNVASAVVGLVTVLIFAIFGPVHWVAVAILAPAAIVGGYGGARFARRLPDRLWKLVITLFGFSIGLVLLVQAYA
ncbi:sulfite exporter TauE/SafE family protein [Natronosporangium hydrolyticum]|uniref:Probable membrane transporter protein n=1 Tax=Natronosporangium hydrolyticum TaxID=2811111 RepID=A0A895YAK6_9ACTN|nr:sulfite exporter TauE/SafE family protein [Natronosporangium hydrolyticum]QSB13282.1 sulfite exporter TauE/SafE family protein [Natronosporangium hydrolyticum]